MGRVVGGDQHAVSLAQRNTYDLSIVDVDRGEIVIRNRLATTNTASHLHQPG